MNLDENNKILFLKSEFFDFMVNQENFQHLSGIYMKYSKLVCDVLGARTVSLYGNNTSGEFFESITYNSLKEEGKEFEIRSKVSVDSLPIEFDRESKYKILHSLNQTILYYWNYDESDLHIVELDFTGEERELEKFSESFLLSFHKETFELRNLLVKLARTIEQGKQYLQLSKITSKLHSSFNIEYVFAEIITSLETVYPNNEYLLLLTNHQSVEPSHLPVKQFSPMDEDANPFVIQAYSENITTFEKKDGSIYMYSPVHGQQGVYGVLQIANNNLMRFTVYEQEFFTLLASKAGIALENAKLYQQVEDSAKRIQFVNEVGQNLNQNLHSLELISYLVNKFQTRFECEEFAIVILKDNTHLKVLDGSTEFFKTRIANGLIQQIVNDTMLHGGTLLKVHASQENCYQDYPFNSIVAVKVETTGLQGIAIMLHREPFKFKYDDRTLVENVMEPTKLALRNTMLQEKLEQLVATDHLTDLYSRAYLEEHISKSMQEDSQGTLILLDIDDFKKINDTYGHQIGDNVLIQVANIIKDVVRSTDIAARWGGEELAAYLPKIGIEHGKKVASRIIEEVEKISNPRVTTSCGVSAWGSGNSNSSSIDKLFKSADDALYIAKNTGKNKVTIAN